MTTSSVGCTRTMVNTTVALPARKIDVQCDQYEYTIVGGTVAGHDNCTVMICMKNTKLGTLRSMIMNIYHGQDYYGQ